MKFHLFSVLSIAGVILLSGSSFGSEVRWKKPVKSESVVTSVSPIPSVITTDGSLVRSAILPVQYDEPFQQPFQPLPPVTTAPLPPGTPDHSYNPPPGAAIQTVPLALPLPGTPPVRVRDTEPCGNQIVFKSIRDISHDIRPATTGELPRECYIESKPFDGRYFSQSCYMWKASALSTKGAYFEDTQLERHGHTHVRQMFQPFVSGAKFFGTIAILPYKMGVDPPTECIYTLGHYRSGSCAPYMQEPFPISARGALFQAGAVAGVILAAP